MTLDLRNQLHRLLDVGREFVAFDAATAEQHLRIREEAALLDDSTRALRLRFIDQGLELAERERALRTDVLLVCATQTELEELQAAAASRDLGWEPIIGSVGPYFNLGRVGGDRVSVIKLKEMGSNRPDGSAFTCHRALAETQATSVIGVGTAFGVDEAVQDTGDVVISTAIFMYEESTVLDIANAATGVRYKYKPSAKIPASTRWLDRFYEMRRGGWRTPSGRDGMHLGVLLAGAKRVESLRFRDELVKHRVPPSDDPVVGGEMEAAGIAAACRAPVEWIVVKGISDFGTKKSRRKISKTRTPAARAAAECVLDALEGPALQ